MVRHQLVMQPDVLDCQSELLEQMKNQLQLRIYQWLTGNSAIEHGNTDQSFAIQDWYCDLAPQQLEFLLCFQIVTHFLALNAQNSAGAIKVSANARFKGQLKVLK